MDSPAGSSRRAPWQQVVTADTCPACGLVSPSPGDSCEWCGAELHPGPLPGDSARPHPRTARAEVFNPWSGAEVPVVAASQAAPARDGAPRDVVARDAAGTPDRVLLALEDRTALPQGPRIAVDGPAAPSGSKFRAPSLTEPDHHAASPDRTTNPANPTAPWVPAPIGPAPGAIGPAAPAPIGPVPGVIGPPVPGADRPGPGVIGPASPNGQQPVVPSAPGLAPSAPGGPVAPEAPGMPIAPTAPGSPVAATTPGDPVAPTAAVPINGPLVAHPVVVPAGSVRIAMLAAYAANASGPDPSIEAPALDHGAALVRVPAVPGPALRVGAPGAPATIAGPGVVGRVSATGEAPHAAGQVHAPGLTQLAYPVVLRPPLWPSGTN